MDSSRRSFLQVAGLVMASSALPPIAKAAKFASGPRVFGRDAKGWPIVQGPTDSTSTSLIVMHDSSDRFEVRITGPQKEVLPFQFLDRWAHPGSSLVSSGVFVGGLLPGLNYTLELVGEAGEVLDSRTFGALDISRSQCRFAVMSCLNDTSLMGNHVYSMWEALQKEQCDFVVLLGDTCYADLGNGRRDKESYARRYAETRNLLSWFRMPRLTPTLAVWDDHDFGLNNSDRSFPMADFTRLLFRKFWGSNAGPVWKKTFGVGSLFEAFGQRFYLMDDRSYRDAPNISGGRHWGAEQMEWLLSDLARNDSPAWLMNGSQFFGGYLGKESFEGNHPEDFAYLKSKLASVRAPVVFVSGDVHFSEHMQIEPAVLGYPTYEFTSSSMHSFTFPYQQNRAKNPRRLLSEWRHNFMVFEASVGMGTDWAIDSRCVLEGNAVSYRHSARVSRS